MNLPTLINPAVAIVLLAGVLVLVVTACSGAATVAPATGNILPTPEFFDEPTDIPMPSGQAEVVGVSVTGNPGDYAFSVIVGSPDQGCSTYADWWEVVSEEGALLYRRVLLHSHVEEQPFTRSGGPLEIQPTDVVIVRAHMSDAGYGGSVMRGTVAGGFSIAEVSPNFASNLEGQAPLPTDCAF